MNHILPLKPITLHAPWCTQHEPGEPMCTSTPIGVAPGCYVWLLRPTLGAEPVVVVDTSPTGAELRVDEALELADALRALADAAQTNTVVRWQS